MSRRASTALAVLLGSLAFAAPAGLELRIHEIQGAAHLSPYDGQLVSGVPGVVTARSSNGFWMQDPAPDTDPATSEGIFVFTGGAPPAAAVVGNAVTVGGRVQEFRAGCFPSCSPSASAFDNLSTTEIVTPTVAAAGTRSIAPTLVGPGGRVPRPP